MGALLEDRVAAWVADHPGQTCRQIAAELHARLQSVREILDSPLFVAASVDERGMSRWQLRTSGDALGSVVTSSRGETDAEYLLRVLSDGRPHTLNEILRRSFAERGCGLTVHSRAADLRKQGLPVINYNRQGAQRGEASVYQLVASTEPSRVGTAAPSRAAWEGSAGATGTSGSPGSDAQPVAPDYQQLSLEQVA